VVDYQRLMAILSVPRPNGSPAEREACGSLCAYLDNLNIPYRRQAFKQYPHFFEAIGVWIIFSRSLLAVAAWMHWGWPAFLIAILGLAGGTLDVAVHLPLVSWPGARRGENILMTFEPARAQQEVILSAHYDSKTEFLDHRQRMFFLKSLPLGIFLTLLLGILGPIETWLLAQSPTMASAASISAALLSVPMLALAWGLGLNLSVGRFLRPSQGAMDNGAACAILVGLAGQLAAGEIPLRRTRVTVALFSGEEVNRQGSRAYVKSRDWSLGAVAVNLEAMAQDGDYVIWERDGSVFKLTATSADLNRAVAQAITWVTKREPRAGGPVISDGASFLAAGVPTAVIGTYDCRQVDAGFHRPSDCLSRVVPEHLPEGVEILKSFLLLHDNSSPVF
jgi:hypothetical protein